MILGSLERIRSQFYNDNFIILTQEFKKDFQTYNPLFAIR